MLFLAEPYLSEQVTKTADDGSIYAGLITTGNVDPVAIPAGAIIGTITCPNDRRDCSDGNDVSSISIRACTFANARLPKLHLNLRRRDATTRSYRTARRTGSRAILINGGNEHDASSEIFPHLPWLYERVIELSLYHENCNNISIGLIKSRQRNDCTRLRSILISACGDRR